MYALVCDIHFHIFKYVCLKVHKYMMIELALYSDRRYVHCTKTYYVWRQDHFECAYHIFPQNILAYVRFNQIRKSFF